MRLRIISFAFVFISLQVGFMVSCWSTPSKSQQRELTKDHLMASIGKMVADSTIKAVSAEMMDTIEMYLDSVLPIIRNENSSIDDILVAKSFCLITMNGLLEKEINSSSKRLEQIIEKNGKIQFEFLVTEQEKQYCMSLANVFLPSNHKSGPLADYFDFYAYFDKNTGQCNGILCVLPTLFENKENKPQVFAFLKVNTMDEKTIDLEVSEPEYSEEYGCWQIMIHGSEFNKIMQYGNIYFFVTDNGKEGMEASTINLTRFKEQYEELSKE